MCKECSPARAARVARMEVQAERLGDLQKFLGAAPFVPSAAVLGFVAVAGLAIGAIESIHIPL